MNPKELTPATTLQNGKYIIESVLGKGGFGITYLATYGHLKKPLAVKELFLSSEKTFCSREGTTVKPHFETERFEYFKTRFKDEAITLTRFEGVKGIVQVYEIFEENDTIYLAMEYLRGKNISQIVKEKGAFNEHDAVNIITQLLTTLTEVHKAGLLHRDIGPANIIVNDKGIPVLLDFGIAREFDEDITITHTTFLTIGYSAPEQGIERARRGPYTDLYSVGATLYFMLTGNKPQTSAEVNISGYDSVKKINNTISPALDKIVEKAMQQRQADRYQTCEEFLDILQHYNNSNTEPAKRVTQPVKQQQPKPIVKEPVVIPEVKKEVKEKAPASTSPGTNKKALKIGAIIAGALAVIVVVVIVALNSGNKTEENKSSTADTTNLPNDSTSIATALNANIAIIEDFSGNTKFETHMAQGYREKSYIENEAYYLVAGDKDQYKSVTLPVDQSRNFIISCKVWCIEGQDNLPMGVFWGADAKNNKSLRLGICMNGSTLGRYWNGSTDNKFYGVNSSLKAKKNAFNVLEVHKDADGFHSYLNGEQVYTQPLFPFYGNNFGFFVSQNCTAKFDDFTIIYND